MRLKRGSVIEEINLDHMTREERDEAWDVMLKRIRLFAAPSSEPDDRIAFVLRTISLLPKDVREMVLEESCLYISLEACSEKCRSEFSKAYSSRAMEELELRQGTLVKRLLDGKKCILIQIPAVATIETVLAVLLQVARLVVGFPGYSWETCELSPDLEGIALEFAAVLNEYVKVEIVSCYENQGEEDGSEA